MSTRAYPQPFERAEAVRDLRGLLTSLALLTLSWGALAFGAVYPWAYWPLALACQVCGFACLWIDRDDRRGYPNRAFVIVLGAFAATALLQLVPLSPDWLAAISPKTIEALNSLDTAFVAGLTSSHPLSIVPSRTVTAIALYGSFVVFLLGLARVFSLSGVQRFAEGVTVLGVVLALVGIIQKPLYTGRLYGFWTPFERGDVFGPFVNRNHFAGWMLMALPVTLGLLTAGLERGMRDVKPDLRSRLLWLSSPDANRLILIAGAAVLMALALVLTMSRSGMAALAIAILVTGAAVVRAGSARSRKVAGLAYLLVLALTVGSWVGVDAIAQRFSRTNATEFEARRGAWADTIDVARSFPVSGTGLNTFGVATLLYQRHNLDKHYEQSHNDYLQLVSEGGLLLAIPAALAVIMFLRAVARGLRENRGSSSWWIRAGAVTGLLAIALQEMFDFSLQMPGNAALFAAVCAVAIHESARRS